MQWPEGHWQSSDYFSASTSFEAAQRQTDPSATPDAFGGSIPQLMMPPPPPPTLSLAQAQAQAQAHAAQCTAQGGPASMGSVEEMASALSSAYPALTPSNLEDFLRSPQIGTSKAEPQVPLTMNGLGSAVVPICVDPSLAAHATPSAPQPLAPSQLVPTAPLAGTESEDGAELSSGTYDEHPRKRPRARPAGSPSPRGVNSQLQQAIMQHQRSTRSPAGAGAPRSVIPSVATLELSSYKLCKYRKYEVRMTITRQWRTENRLSEIDILQALIGAKCCKLGTSQAVACDRCSCDQVVTLSATTQWPVRRDGSESETYLCAIQSRCTSSRDHLRSSLVLLIDNLPFPVPLTTEPFVLLARDKSGMRARGSQSDSVSFATPSAPGKKRARGHQSPDDGNTGEESEGSQPLMGIQQAPPPPQSQPQLHLTQQQQQLNDFLSPTGIRYRLPVVPGPAIKFGLDSTMMLPEASMTPAFKKEEPQQSPVPGNLPPQAQGIRADPSEWGSGTPNSCKEFLACASGAVPSIAQALIQSEGLKAFIKDGYVSQDVLKGHASSAFDSGSLSSGLQDRNADEEKSAIVIVRLLMLKMAPEAKAKFIDATNDVLHEVPGFVRQCHHDLQGGGLIVTITTYVSQQDVAACDNLFYQFVRNKIPNKPNPLNTDLMASGLLTIMAECKN